MKPPPSKHVPVSPCTRCGQLNDRAFSADLRNIQPKPGDASLCSVCGHVMIFSQDMILRDPDADEQRDLDANRSVQIARVLHAQFMREQKKH